MTSAFRLFKKKYPASSEKGAALYGGRWNSVGFEVIYSASSVSLAALEILANYAVIPAKLSLTRISIPDEVEIEQIADEALPEHWDSIIPGPQSQNFGDQWIEGRRTAVLSVPSSIISSERNFVLNPAHPAFRKIHFSVPQEFVFDPRLRSAAASS